MAQRWPSEEKLASGKRLQTPGEIVDGRRLAIVPPSIHPHSDNRRMHDDYRHDGNEHCRVVVMSSAIGDNAAGSGEQGDAAD
jgi:hypothetical protein